MSPTEIVPADLYALRTAQNNIHCSFTSLALINVGRFGPSEQNTKKRKCMCIPIY